MDKLHYVVVLDDGETYSGIEGAHVLGAPSAAMAMAEDHAEDAQATWLAMVAHKTYPISDLVALRDAVSLLEEIDPDDDKLSFWTQFDRVNDILEKLRWVRGTPFEVFERRHYSPIVSTS